jgi:hypothetical protein
VGLCCHGQSFSSERQTVAGTVAASVIAVSAGTNLPTNKVYWNRRYYKSLDGKQGLI